VPGNSYLPWLDKYFDYVEAYRNILLESSAVLLRILGHDPTVSEYVVRMENGYGVRLVYSCLGFAILSFWWAMILAFPQTLKNKLLYLIGGTLIIVGLNVIRITAVAIVYASKWAREHPDFDHHMVFNIVAYGALFYMLYRWFNIPTTPDNTVYPHIENSREDKAQRQ
jgi:exosortase/archaeosortase family protein